MNENIVVDYKDYTPPKIIDTEFEFEELVLEDVNGVKFNFKFRKPTTSEFIKFKRECSENLIVDGTLISRVKYEELFDKVSSNLDALPKNIKVDMLKPHSIEDVVATFLRQS